MKSKKTLSQNRRARSLPPHLDSTMYTLDLEKGYQPIVTNTIIPRLGRKKTVYGGYEEFSGMEPITNNLKPHTALKVTYRLDSDRDLNRICEEIYSLFICKGLYSLAL